MAFNPFRFFRKHSKVLMGASVILCMVTFVICSGTGRGGFFEGLALRFADLFGRTSKVPKVTTLYGSTVDARELDQLRQQRRIAEEAMRIATSKALQDLDFQQKQKRDKKENMFDDSFWNMQKLQARMQQGIPQQFQGANTVNGLIDFLIWRKQADNLGINLTRDAVETELARWSFANVKLADILATLQGRDARKITPELLEKALADEFRVMFAQEALVGYNPEHSEAAIFSLNQGVAQVPAPVTPYEFYRHFEDERTTLHVSLLRVPVEKTAADASGPSEEELRALYNRFKDQEPRPDLAQPSFKEPRRVKLEWVGAKADSEYYRKESSRIATVLQATTQIGAGAQGFGIGTGVAALAATTATPLAFDARTLAAYEDVRTTLTDASQVTLTAAASLDALPSTLANLAVWNQAEGSPTFLPLDKVKSAVTDRLQLNLGQDLVKGNLTAFKKEMESRQGKPDKIREWLPKGIEEFHLDRHEVMKEPRDQYGIVDDPVVKPLKEAYLRTPMGKNDQRAEQLGFLLAGNATEYTPIPWPLDQTALQFSRSLEWEPKEEPYLFWISDIVKARVPSFDEAKDKVQAAWQLQQARIRAGERAQNLEKEAAKTGGDLQKIKQFAAEQKVELIDLETVAREIPEPVANPTGKRRYQPFKFPDTIRYPGKDWLDNLLNNLKKPGDTTLLQDGPEQNFYVAVLVSRIEPSVQTYHDVYRDVSSSFQEPMWTTMIREQRNKYLESVLKELRIQAGGDEKGQFKIDPEGRKAVEGRGGSDES
jgi:hypothetical protein